MTQEQTQPSEQTRSPELTQVACGRDRYLDLLRSIAVVRVVLYQLFGWAWLTVLFPSMGVLFALAGSLTARSLASRSARDVIGSRVRRLLFPLLAFGALVLTLDSTWAERAAEPLWYVRAYLLFVIASPLLLWAFRRAPWPTLLAPLGLTAVLGTGVVTVPGETGNAVGDFVVYGSCWVLGFAHQEGLLRQVPRYLAVSCSTLLMAFALWWASGRLGPEGWNLHDVPLAQAAWSFGFVVILLQYSPSWRELPGRLARWDKLVTLSNNRAVTIYLWHSLLIMATFSILDLL
jgi:hypothetical protein